MPISLYRKLKTGNRKPLNLPPPGDEGGAQIQDHDDDEEHDAGGEQGLPVAAGGVTQLQGDIAGQGAHRVQNRSRDLEGVASHHDHRHGLPDGPAHPENNCGNDAGGGRGQHHPANRLPAGGPQGQRAVPIEVRHRGEGVDGDADDRGENHDAQNDGRGQQRQPGPPQVVADEGHQPDDPQKAIHHRGNAGQEFQGGLQHHFEALRGELRQHDGTGQAQGYADNHGPQGDENRGDDHGQDAEMALGGGPVTGQNEVLQPDGEDEGKTLHKNKNGDEGQGADGRQGQEQQHAFDEFLPVYHSTPTRPSVSRIFWPSGPRTKSTKSLPGPAGATRATKRKRRVSL